MKNILLLLLVALSSSTFSQVAFQNISFAEALTKAKTEDRLIFLQFEAPDCHQCTEVANKAFSDKVLSETINQTFIPLFVRKKHKERKEIESLFNTQDGFGTLFIDQNGTLIHKFSATVSMPEKYKEQIDITLYKAGESLKVNELEKEYRNGNKTPGFLEMLLLKKKELNLNTTALLDEYVTLLPADSLTSIYTLQFIASMAPVLGTKSDIFLRNDHTLFNQVWYTMPLNKRVNINARIINSSLNKAVQDKDEAYAIQVATFSKSTVTSTKAAAEKAYYKRLLEFYERADDQPKYLTTAVHYYENYVMTVDVDSIKQVDEVMRDRISQTAKKDTVKTETGFSVKSTIGFSPSAQRYTWDLKEGAQNLYAKTSDPALLAMATTWIKKAIQFSESFEALDVYAHLLYKQNQIEQAIAIEKQAIDLKKKRKFPVKDNEDVLLLMEKRLPLNN